jgi:hypothetical protein
MIIAMTVDFRVESDGNANMLFVDASVDRVGVGATPMTNGSTFQVTSDSTEATNMQLTLRGASDTNKQMIMGFDTTANTAHVTTQIAGSAPTPLIFKTGNVVFNEAGSDSDFRVEGENTTHGLFFDASADKFCIGTATGSVSSFSFSELESSTCHAWFGHSDTNTNSPVLYINREASDGALIKFFQASTEEGNISVSGSTVSYNGFSGRHESSGIPANTPVGTVVSTIDELDVYPDKTTDTQGNAIPHLKAGQTRADHAQVEVSTSTGDPCVYGVVSEFDGNGKLIVTSVGIGSIRVTGACSKGDLLESNGDGTAKVQSDDIIRSKTIGKVTIGNSDTGVKLVACVMYCG